MFSYTSSMRHISLLEYWWPLMATTDRILCRETPNNQNSSTTAWKMRELNQNIIWNSNSLFWNFSETILFFSFDISTICTNSDHNLSLTNKKLLMMKDHRKYFWCTRITGSCDTRIFEFTGNIWISCTYMSCSTVVTIFAIFAFTGKYLDLLLRYSRDTTIFAFCPSHHFGTRSMLLTLHPNIF